jgi:hypothetical protein
MDWGIIAAIVEAFAAGSSRSAFNHRSRLNRTVAAKRLRRRKNEWAISASVFALFHSFAVIILESSSN